MLILCSPFFKKLYPRCTLNPKLNFNRKYCRIHVASNGRFQNDGRRFRKIVWRRSRPSLVRLDAFSSRRPLSVTSFVFGMRPDNDDVNDSIYEQLMTASSIDNALALSSSVELLTPRRIAVTFVTLDRLAYDHLSTLPWAIQDNRVLLFIQAALNNESKDFFQPIIRCTEFEMLKNDAKKSCNVFTDSALVAVTISLLRLNVDPTDETLVALLQECRNRCETFDLVTLSAFSDVGNYMKRSGFPISADLSRIVQQRWDDIAVTVQDFDCISRLIFNLGYFMPADTLWHFQSKIALALVHLKTELPISHVLDILEPVFKFSERLQCELIGACLKILDLKANEMRPYDLFRALQDLVRKRNDKYAPQFEALRIKIGERAYKLLNDGLRASDFIYVANVLDMCKYPHNSRSTVEKLMEIHMNDFDVVLLKKASVWNIVASAHNLRLSYLYCQRVQRKLEDLVESMSCLLSVVHCLSMMKARPLSVDNVFVTHLLEMMSSSQMGMQPRHVSAIGRYLIRCLCSNLSRDHLPHGKAAAVFTEKIIRMLPRFTIIEMINLANGFSERKSNLGESLQKYRSQPPRLYKDRVLSRFALEIMSRKHEITNLTVLNFVMDSVVLNLSDALCEELTHDLIELYDRHTLDIRKQIDVKLAFNILLKLRLRIPDVLERLSNSFVEFSQDRCTVADVSLVTNTLSKLNYRPTKVDQVTAIAESIAVDELERTGEGGDLTRVLQIVTALSMLDVFPEKIIQRVFSLDFLNRLEDIINALRLKGKFKSEKYLQKLLMQLNRTAIIQCPHLYIPWFCDDYVKKLPNVPLFESALVRRWKEVIEYGLADSLGGIEFVKQGPLFAQYGLIYDFECKFNEYGKPVPHSLSDEQHLRVAVLLAKPKHFSMNGRSLMASLETRITQLEILGFKVVVIPCFELDSMQLSDRESRNEYFREKMHERNTCSTFM